MQVTDEMILRARNELAKHGIEQTFDEVKNDPDAISVLTMLCDPNIRKKLVFMTEATTTEELQINFKREYGEELPDENAKVTFALIKAFANG